MIFLALFLAVCCASLSAISTNHSPKPVVLWVTNFICWETDHLLEIFQPRDFVHIQWEAVRGNKSLAGVESSRFRVLVYNIQNAGKDVKYSEARDLLAAHPSINVLVHLSDEWQGAGRKWRHTEGVDLYKLPQIVLVLRQHSPFPHELLLKENMTKVMTLPLGYMRGMLHGFTNRTVVGPNEPQTGKKPGLFSRRTDPSGRQLDLQTSTDVASQFSSVIKSIDRAVNWSFVGEKEGHNGHVDRRHGLHVFSVWKPHKVGKMPMDEMFALYLNSRFVPVGRGNKALDCFRMTEAIIAGAIPIVVGPAIEVNWTFAYHGPPALVSTRPGYRPNEVGHDAPPAIFSETWEEALATCRGMSHAQIDARREQLVQWYVRRMRRLRESVFQTITAERR